MLSLKAKHLIDDFESAAVSRSWMGAAEPDTHRKTIQEYDRCRNAVLQYIENLEARIKERRCEA